MDVQSYKYRPLTNADEIRLLHLETGSPHDALRGRIEHVRLESLPAFDAISYVWGQHERTEVLHTPDGPIPITRSLFRALRRVRMRGQLRHLSYREFLQALLHDQKPAWHLKHPYWDEDDVRELKNLNISFDSVVDHHITHRESEDLRALMSRLRKPIVVWADAVCIDQRAQGEKVHQVGMMGDIFATASTVWVYLGEVFRLPENVMEHSRERRGLVRACKDLFDNQWFHRAWTLQEFVLARRVKGICGPRSFDMEKLSDLIETHFVSEVEAVHAADMLRLRCDRILGKLPSFEQLLQSPSLVGRRCTVPQDRIWAFLPLACDKHGLKLKPDYDTPLQDLLVRLAMGFLQSPLGIRAEVLLRAVAQGSFARRTLRASSHELRYSSCLPSWMPDVLGNPSRSRLLNLSQPPVHFLDAKIDAKSGILSLKGTMMQVLEEEAAGTHRPQLRSASGESCCPSLVDIIGGLLFYVTFLGDDPEFWKLVYWSIDRLPKRNTMEAGDLARLIRIIGADGKRNTHIRAVAPDMRLSIVRGIVAELIAQAPVVKDGCQFTCSKMDHGQAAGYRRLTQSAMAAHILLDALQHWRVYRTVTGTAVLGPPGARTGDRVCRLPDFQQDLLLRPLDGITNRYHLVGCIFSPYDAAFNKARQQQIFIT